MDCELAVSSPELGLKKDQLLPGLDDDSFTAALTELHWRDKAALDFNGRQPELRLGEGSNGDEDVDHRDSEAPLHIAKVILEGGLRRKDENDAPCLDVRVFNYARRERGTVWLRLGVEQGLQFSGFGHGTTLQI
jgi:hypothetical protein